MKPNSHPGAAWLLLILLTAIPASLSAADKPAGEKDKPTEKQKIEALLKHLENLKDASFVRNDTVVQPKEAATLMRSKWETQGKEIKTATEFIDRIMTSSSSGPRKPYLIRFKDGKEAKCADLLKAELKKLEATPPEIKKP